MKTLAIVLILVFCFMLALCKSASMEDKRRENEE